MRASLFFSTLATLCVSSYYTLTVQADDQIVDLRIDLCNQNGGYSVELPGTSTILHLYGLQHSSLFDSQIDEYGVEIEGSFLAKVTNFLYYYKFQWSEVNLRFYDEKANLIDYRDELVLGEGQTVEDAVNKRDHRTIGNQMAKQFTNLLTWPIQIMTGEIKNMFSFRSKQQILEDTENGLASSSSTSPYKRNPYEEMYIAVKQDSVRGRKNGQTFIGRDVHTVKCTINTIAIQYPILLILGTYAAVNAEVLATSWLTLYVGGSAIGVVVALTLIVYFVYRNRDNKLVLGSFGLSVMFGSAATWFHDTLSNFFEHTLGAPWLADYAWVLPLLIIFISIVTTVFFCLRLRGNTSTEKKITLNTLAYIIRTVGIILVYNSFQIRSVGILVAASTVLPCFFVSMFQWLEDVANYLLSWLQMVGCFKGKRFTCVSNFRNRYGCRRVDVIGDVIREEEAAEQVHAPVDPTPRTPGSNKKRRNSIGGLAPAEVSRLIKHAGTDKQKLNQLTEFLNVLDQANSETEEEEEEPEVKESVVRAPHGSTSSVRRRPSVAR